MGLTQAQIDGLVTYATNPAYNDLQKAVIRYAEDMTKNVAAADASFQAVRKALEDQELVELSMTIAVANLTNRLNETFKTELEH